ncbi:MAG: phage major capsid protein [Candidatus Bathyarchaeia archaeon]
MSQVKLSNIVEAYEYVYGRSWDSSLLPTAEELALLAPSIPVGEKQPETEKLKEYRRLGAFTLRGDDSFWDWHSLDSSGENAGRDDALTKERLRLREAKTWGLNARGELIREKLKEATLSDQAYAVAEINRIVWEALKPNLVARELVTIWHTDRPSYRFIKAVLIPRAFDVDEHAEIPVAGEKYEYTDAKMRKIGVRPQISREAIEDAVWDIVARQLAEGARAMSQKESEILIGSNGIFNTAASSGNEYQGYGKTVTCGTSGTLAYSDLVAAIASLRSENAYPDTLVVNPSEEGDLLKDDKFIHAFYFGGFMKKSLGPAEYFGQILGFRTLTTTIQPSGSALLLQTSGAAGIGAPAAAMVIRRDVTVENLIDPIKDLTSVAFTERFQFRVGRHLALCQIQSA